MYKKLYTTYSRLINKTVFLQHVALFCAHVLHTTKYCLWKLASLLPNFLTTVYSCVVPRPWNVWISKKTLSLPFSIFLVHTKMHSQLNHTKNKFCLSHFMLPKSNSILVKGFSWIKRNDENCQRDVLGRKWFNLWAEPSTDYILWDEFLAKFKDSKSHVHTRFIKLDSGVSLLKQAE